MKEPIQIEIPEGWEIVPGGDVIPDGAKYKWENQSFWSSAVETIGKTVSDARKNYPEITCFIRRKSQPVSAVESGAEQVATDLSATHRLKCWPEFFQAIVDGKKTFEARKNDRDYREGDSLLLLEWENGNYTGRSYRVLVSHILYGPKFGIERDYCVMSLAGYAKGAAK